MFILLSLGLIRDIKIVMGLIYSIDDNLEECTFQPNCELSHQVQTDIQMPKYDEPLPQRAMKHAEDRKKRLEEYEKTKAERLDEECTFQPKRYVYKSNIRYIFLS